ncbi:MAG: DUF2478 domain-containing protein [Rhodospirillales bacterium]|nr:DUF2478 domain-containing protein [Rhodospirillales bacterium]
MESVRAPWIRPGAVVHDPQVNIDDLLADFAFALRDRGFRVSGFVQMNNRQPCALGSGRSKRINLLDLDTGQTIAIERDPSAANDHAIDPAVFLACECKRYNLYYKNYHKPQK